MTPDEAGVTSDSSDGSNPWASGRFLKITARRLLIMAVEDIGISSPFSVCLAAEIAGNVIAVAGAEDEGEVMKVVDRMPGQDVELTKRCESGAAMNLN